MYRVKVWGRIVVRFLKDREALVASAIGFAGVLFMIHNQDVSTKKSIEAMYGVMRQEAQENDKKTYIHQLRDIQYGLSSVRPEVKAGGETMSFGINEDDLRLIKQKLVLLPLVDVGYLRNRYLYLSGLMSFAIQLSFFSENRYIGEGADSIRKSIDSIRLGLLDSSREAFDNISRIMPDSQIILSSIERDVVFFSKDVEWIESGIGEELELRVDLKYMQQLFSVILSSQNYLTIVTHSPLPSEWF